MATVADLRPCNVSLVRVPFGRNGASLVCERRVAPSIRRINARYLADPRSYRYPIRAGDTGGFNCRHTTSGTSWSKHAYGCAEDVNWSTNGYNASHHDMPLWFVQLWIDEGWGYGGFWNHVKDWMHFSKFPNEGGDGKLEDETTEEALVVTPQDEAKIREIVKEEVKEQIDEHKFFQIAIIKNGTEEKVGFDVVLKAMAQNPGKAVLGPNGEWLV